MPARPVLLTPEKSARHMFGYLLRVKRENAGLTQEALGKKIAYGPSTIARVERAVQIIPPGLPAALDAEFETKEFSEQYLLARQENHPPKFRTWLEYEAEAKILQYYASCLIPGLVQTEAYARAQFRAANPRASVEQIEELIQARMERRTLITQGDPPDVWLLLDEAVIRRPLGGRATMRAQLADLLQIAELPTLHMQVLPFDLGAHALLGGTVILAVLRNGKQLAWEEGSSTGTLIEEPSAVDDRARGYDLLRASAPSPKQSVDIVKAAMEAL